MQTPKYLTLVMICQGTLEREIRRSCAWSYAGIMGLIASGPALNLIFFMISASQREVTEGLFFQESGLSGIPDRL